MRDLQRRLGQKDLISWIDKEGERLASLGLRSNSWNVEFTPSLLSDRNIQGISAGRISSDARISPVDFGVYRITFREGLPDYGPYYPRRFAIAHEIGHTYWFASDSKGLPLSPYQNRVGADKTIEGLCNRFAACLLLPRERLLKALTFLSAWKEGELAPLHIIPTLSDYFRVAERAIVQRLIFFLDLSLCTVICLRP
jgi:hypothetical protein